MEMKRKNKYCIYTGIFRNMSMNIGIELNRKVLLDCATGAVL